MNGPNKLQWNATPARRTLAGRLWLLVKIAFVFHLVAFAWIFFRAPDFASAWTYIVGLAGQGSAAAFPFSRAELLAMGVSILMLVLLIDLPQYRNGEHTTMLRWPFLLRVAAVTLLLFGLILSKGNHNVAFIYFQF